MNIKKIAGMQRLGTKTLPTNPEKAAKMAKEKEDEFRQQVRQILKSKKGGK